jgi:putative heme-binding domain-containing protein
MTTYRPIRNTLLAILAVAAISAFTELSGAGQSSTPPGDPAHGETILESRNCLTCHRVADRGSRLGPDLSAIGSERTLAQLEKALFDPGSEVQPQNRLFRVQTRRGETITGKLLNQDLYSVQMLDSKDRLLALNKTDLREAGFIATPPMPSYRDQLNTAEKADLVAYLASLKGVVRQ